MLPKRRKETRSILAGVPLVMYVDGRCAANADRYMAEKKFHWLNINHFNLNVIRRMDTDPAGISELRACEVRFLGAVKMVTLHDNPLKTANNDAARLVVIQTDGGIEYDVVTKVVDPA